MNRLEKKIFFSRIYFNDTLIIKKKYPSGKEFI